MVKKVAVLGAGHGGCGFAGHLTIKGFDVALYEHPKFKKNIDEIKEKGGVELIGAITGFAKIKNATTEIKDVIPGAQVIMVTVPAFVQMEFMQQALPYLEDGQIVVFNPDNFASLAFKELIRQQGVKKDIKIAGTASLMYACRKSGPASVNIYGIKHDMPVAALPSADTAFVVKTLKELFTEFEPAQNVLQMGFANMNMIIHCPTAILNAGRIEDTKGDFSFYWNGMTGSVCRVMEKADAERVGVAARLGVKMPSTHEELIDFYRGEKPGVDLHDFLTHSRVHGGHGPDAPADLFHRYVHEDVPYGFVPVSSFGKLLGIPTPTIDSLTLLASVMNKTDYSKTGRTIEKMGLAGKSAAEIAEFCQKAC